MPGRGRKSQYTSVINSELRMRVIGVLADATDYENPTIDYIKRHDIVLSDYTSQKLARVLNSLVEIGAVRKGKGKDGRMVYRLVSQVEKDNYAQVVPFNSYVTDNWELEEERLRNVDIECDLDD